MPNFFTSHIDVRTIAQKGGGAQGGKYLTDSYINLFLPLATNMKMRLKLNNVVQAGMRIGRMFEVMDSVAGMVTYEHCSSSYEHRLEDQEIVCVTGSVESLHLFEAVDVEKDLTVEGYLNHVGRTSMEVSINVLQDNTLKAFSLFTMIARSAKDPAKGMQVPALDLGNLSEVERIRAQRRREEAKANAIQRKRLMEDSYDVKAPSPEDIAAIHSLFLQRKEDKSHDVSNSTPVGETIMSNTEVMHSQERNLHGKVFGGFLIREMIELGVLTAWRYA